MNNKVKDLLDKINEDEKEFGVNIYAKIPQTNDNEIKHFNKWIEKYNKNGFSEYIDLIKILNGLNYNGFYLYSLNKECEFNIKKMNELWWDQDEELKQYIFFADADISWYCLNKDNGKYYLLDKPSGDVMNEYETFDEIITAVRFSMKTPPEIIEKYL